MREGTVWIAEDWDFEGSTFWSGRFGAVWNGPDGVFQEGPRVGT